MLLVVLMTSCANQQEPEMLPKTETPPSPKFTTNQPLSLDKSGVSKINSTSTFNDSKMIFVGEIIPNGTNMQPGQAFQKTWTIKNGGFPCMGDW